MRTTSSARGTSVMPVEVAEPRLTVSERSTFPNVYAAPGGGRRPAG
jgi:hypothetical protein